MATSEQLAIEALLLKTTECEQCNLDDSYLLAYAVEAAVRDKPMEQALLYYKEKVHGPFGITLCVCGIALNLISCSIWRKRHVLLTGNVPLMAISLCYTVVCFAYLPLLVTLYCLTPLSAPKERRNSYFNMLLALVCNQLQLTAHAVILWLGVLIAFQRAVCISSRVPLRQNRLLSKQTTQVCIALLILLVVATSAASYTVSELTPRSCYGNQSTVSMLCRNTTSAINSSNATRSLQSCRTVTFPPCSYYAVKLRPPLRNVVHWVHITLHKLMPCTFMVLLSCFLSRSLDQLVGRSHLFVSRDSLSRDDREVKRLSDSASSRFSHVSQHVTRILILLVVSMVATQLPPAAALMFNSEAYKRFGELFDVCSLLYIAASFVLYCKMSATFRREFVAQCDSLIRLLCWSCVRRAGTATATASFVSVNLTVNVNVNDSVRHKLTLRSVSQPALPTNFATSC